MKQTLLLLAQVLLLWIAVRKMATVIGTCCCGHRCSTCNCATDDSGEPCSFRTISVTGSGFTGSCSLFNGTFTLTYEGGWNPPADQNCPPACLWHVAVVGGGDVYFSQGGSQVSGYTWTVLYYLNGTQVESYRITSNQHCPPPSVNTTLNRQGAPASCAGAPATITILPDFHQQASCDCYSTENPLPALLHLTVTNSTIPSIPNGIYTMPYKTVYDGFPNGYYCIPAPSADIATLTFALDYPDASNTDPGCSKRRLALTCNLGVEVDSFAQAGCTCNPVTANGHMVVAGGAGGDCADGSFDWSISE